jgi:uncharacterized cupredoxin-like copper-binding protein
MNAFKPLVLALALAIAGGATAHGDTDHANKAGPVKKEQKDWGIAGESKSVKRTIEIGMSDAMKFTPDRIEARLGETVKFVLRNRGALVHEFVLGTKKELDEHAALMIKFPTMEHDEPDMAHVGPGKTGEIVWTFNRAGDFDFACLIAGHYQSGMVGKVKVVAVAATAAGIADMTDGEVRKIDLDAGKLTLKHGEIRSLDMPAMTMVFVVKDKRMLERLKAGDKVRFRAVNEGGVFTVTDLEASK